jgi:hypothetical protein
MKRLLLALMAGATLVLSSGCIVAPARPGAAVYVEPTYVSPGPGWVWQFHGGYGWGWHHPHHGWHRGWR